MSEPMITIAPITPSDLLQLAILLTELIEEPVSAHCPAIFAEMEQRGNYHLLGAKVDGELVGSLMGILCLDMAGDGRPFMVIENVVVAQKAQGRGIGRALMGAIEEIARSHRCAYTMFVSGKHRIGAHAFYESIGYAKDLVQGFKKYL